MQQQAIQSETIIEESFHKKDWIKITLYRLKNAFCSSCSEVEFTCGNGACIDIDARCDNINDCDDRSDEADCTRLTDDETYQKFIVPPPNDGKDKLEVKVSVKLSKIMDIRYIHSTYWSFHMTSWAIKVVQNEQCNRTLFFYIGSIVFCEVGDYFQA